MNIKNKPSKKKLFYVKRPVAVVTITIGWLIFGVISLLKLPQDLLPNLEEPTITIETKMDGSSTKEVEKYLTKVLEERLGTVSGLKEMNSVSLPGTSVVKLKFFYDYNFDEAIQNIREKVSGLRFPSRVEKPKIMRFDPSLAPFARISFSSNEKSVPYIRSVVEKNIVPVIESLSGIALASLRGGREKEVHISFKRGLLESYGLTPNQITEIIKSNHDIVGIGKIENSNQSLQVKVGRELNSIAELKKVKITLDQNKTVTLEDISTIEMALSPSEIITRMDGSEAIFLDIYKEADANIVETVENLTANLGPSLMDRNWMKSIQFKIIQDKSKFIKSSIEGVKDAALFGGMLAIIILYFFLGRFLSSFLVALSIPISAAFTFFLMGQAGISINVMSLGGLALGIGMLVDNSIVVLEAINKNIDNKMPKLDAVIEGTVEMMGPVTASTLTTVAVFAPLIFIEGMAGILFNDLASTIVFSLLSSLLVAIIVLPTLFVFLNSYSKTKAKEKAKFNFFKRGSKYLFSNSRNYIKKYSSDWSNKTVAKKWLTVLVLPFSLAKLLSFLLFDILVCILVGIIYGLKLLFVVLKYLFIPVSKILNLATQLIYRFLKSLENNFYPKFLRQILQKKMLSLGFLIGLAAISLVLVSDFESELIPSLSSTELTIEGKLPIGSPIQVTNTTSLAFENTLRNTKGITSVIALVGKNESSAFQGESGLNKFYIDFTIDPLIYDGTKLSEVLSEFEGVEYKISEPSVKPVSSSPIEIVVSDPDMERLEEAALGLLGKLESLSYLQVEKNTIPPKSPEISIAVNPNRIASLKVDSREISGTLKKYFNEDIITYLTEKEETLPVKLNLKGKDKLNLEQLSQFPIINRDKDIIYLSQVGKIEKVMGPTSIVHLNGSRSVRLGFKVIGKPLSFASDKIKKVIADHKKNANSNTEYFLIGQDKEFESSKNELLFAILLSILLVYIVMASQFESFLQPLLIMASIPLAFIGVILFLAPFSQPINIMVFVGSIVLVGIIVNNAIVYIDTVNTLLEQKIPLEEAIIKAGSKRLRPILMTTLTTVLGLLPMAFSSGEGSELRTMLAKTIVGGLSFGTILSLIILPLLLKITKMNPRKNNQETYS